MHVERCVFHLRWNVLLSILKAGQKKNKVLVLTWLPLTAFHQIYSRGSRKAAVCPELCFRGFCTCGSWHLWHEHIHTHTHCWQQCHTHMTNAWFPGSLATHKHTHTHKEKQRHFKVTACLIPNKSVCIHYWKKRKTAWMSVCVRACMCACEHVLTAVAVLHRNLIIQQSDSGELGKHREKEEGLLYDTSPHIHHHHCPHVSPPSRLPQTPPHPRKTAH